MTFVALAAMILAQVGHSEPSLECMVARSDVVVRASVAEVSREPLPKGWAWIIVTLKVHETLKGRPPEHLQFAEHSLAGDTRYDGLKDAGREILVFLLRNPRHKPGEKEVEARFPFTPDVESRTLVRLGPAVPQEQSWSPLPATVFRNTLDVLEDPAVILESARRAVAAGRGAVGDVRMYWLHLPRSVMSWSGRWGDANQLEVPVDSQLETLAREMIQSPAKVISQRGDSTQKRKDDIWSDGFWAGRMSLAKDDDERRRVRADRERADQYGCDALRYGGALALGQFKSNENVALLKSLLNDEVASVRWAAAEALGEVGAEVPASTMVKWLKAKAASDRIIAAEGLGKMGAKEAASDLVGLLKDEDPAVRLSVARVLGSQLKAKVAAPEFVELLKDADASIRREAAIGLGQMGSKADAAGLAKALHDADAGVRMSAAGALESLGAKEAAADLLGSLNDPDPQVRSRAAGALAGLGAKEAIPELLRVLRGESIEDQVTAARVLGFLCAEEAIPALSGLLTHRAPAIRAVAANALAELGASEAVEAMQPGLADRLSGVRAEAATALTRLGSRAGVPVLLEEARKGTDAARLISLNALRQPDLYRKLKTTGLTRNLGGPPDGVAEAWSKDSGLPLVGGRRAAVQEFRANEGRTHLLRALEWIAGSWGADVILEPDRVRLLTREEALKFWTEWWEGEKARR